MQHANDEKKLQADSLPTSTSTLYPVEIQPRTNNSRYVDAELYDDCENILVLLRRIACPGEEFKDWIAIPRYTMQQGVMSYCNPILESPTLDLTKRPLASIFAAHSATSCHQDYARIAKQLTFYS